MNFLVLPAETKSRRKSTSDLYKGMNVSKALAILKISEREYRELTDIEFRETFSRRKTVSEEPAIQVEVTRKHSQKKTSIVNAQNSLKIIEQSKKFMEENIKMHEAFQFLVKKRSTTHERKLARQETSSTLQSLCRSDSLLSWESQDLAGCFDQEKSVSPLPKRRGSISPYLVGPGTPPPIIIPGHETSPTATDQEGTLSDDKHTAGPFEPNEVGEDLPKLR